jgi:G3E family GTPase
MTDDAVITAHVLTGFLGSGKTSLLKRLLAQPALGDCAVLINEFGEVGIDDALVGEVRGDLVLLKSGCICCTIRGDLRDAMGDLYGRRQRGELPPFRRMVIETTGLADPAPIVSTVDADPMLRHHFRLGNLLTVVDAVNGIGNLDRFPETAKQAAVADRLIVSKIDLAPRPQIEALKARLARLNPAAEILELDESMAAPAALLLDGLWAERGRHKTVAGWFDGAPDHGHADRSRHGDIRAFCLTAERPLEWPAFALWLAMLVNRHGADLLRVKGLLHLAGADSPVVIHGVQHTIHAPLHLRAWPDGEPRTRLVVIARGLDGAALQRSFRAFMGPGAPAPVDQTPAWA